MIEKEYLAEITFGKSTDTYDIEGKCDLSNLYSIQKIGLKDVIEGLKSFEGEIFANSSDLFCD